MDSARNYRLIPKPAPLRSIESLMRISKKRRDIKLFWAAGETVAAIGAAIAFSAWKPMPCVFKHAVAVLTELSHAIGHC